MLKVQRFPTKKEEQYTVTYDNSKPCDDQFKWEFSPKAMHQGPMLTEDDQVVGSRCIAEILITLQWQWKQLCAFETNKLLYKLQQSTNKH